MMNRSIVTAFIGSALLALAGCGDPELPQVNSKLLDPNGNFTIYITNQSFAVDPLDVWVEIDGELVVCDYFEVGTQHTYTPFHLTLAPGTHKLRIWSKKGEAELSESFDWEVGTMGVIRYWYYPESHYDPTPRHFDFQFQDVLSIM